MDNRAYWARGNVSKNQKLTLKMTPPLAKSVGAKLSIPQNLFIFMQPKSQTNEVLFF